MMGIYFLINKKLKQRYNDKTFVYMYSNECHVFKALNTDTITNESSSFLSWHDDHIMWNIQYLKSSLEWAWQISKWLYSILNIISELFSKILQMINKAHKKKKNQHLIFMVYTKLDKISEEVFFTVTRWLHVQSLK